MSFDRHRGAAEPPTSAGPPDRRIQELDKFLREHDPLGLLHHHIAGDPHGTTQLQLHRFDQHYDRLYVAQVVHALPGLNWYKIQMADGHGLVGASLVDSGSLTTIGVRSVTMIAPGSMVLAYMPHGYPSAFILGTLPPTTPVRGGGQCSDWLTQGGGGGYRRERAHQQPMGSLGGGGVQDYTAGRPLDQTAFDRGCLSATGIGWNVNDAEAWLRVNEMCGLFLNLADSYAKLTGTQLDIVSAIHELSARCDEGEARHFIGIATYPWEALGMHERGTDFTEEHDDKAVQLTDPVGKLEPRDAAVQPIYRYQEYAGYFGNLRLLTRPQPAKSSLMRTYDDGAKDLGLFRECISADGAWSLVSAKSLHLGKRCQVLVPREIAPPEHGSGDDARADNYLFSNEFGTAAAHSVAEPVVPAEDTSYFRVAALLDEIVRDVNWKALHAFHYHRGDFVVPDETGEDDVARVFERTQDVLNFQELRTAQTLANPLAKKLNIDKRYGDVNYYLRESFLTFLDDGSIALGCGFGATLIFSGGNIRLEAPGDVEILPGRRLVALAHEGILRFKGSCDITSATRDLRLKAERNLQVLAGNSGKGGLLLESKGEGVDQDYHGKIGEDVTGAGIIIKATQGVAALIGQSCYIRSTRDAITLDGNQGLANIDLYAAAAQIFTIDGLSVWQPVAGRDNVEFVRSHRFGAEVVLGARTTICGPIIGTCASGLILDGNVSVSGDIAAGGCIADALGIVATVPADFVTRLRAITDAGADCVTELLEVGISAFEEVVVWHTGDAPGSAPVLVDMAFSYRDDPAERQYGTRLFVFPETRWQQWARFDMALGGERWDEPVVHYQGFTLYPWPGGKKWATDACFLRLEAHALFDAAAGGGKALGGAYEAPDFGTWSKTTMAAGYRLIK